MSKRRRRRGVNFPPVQGSTVSRGYGQVHQAERKRWQPLVRTGRIACARCGFLILAGDAWCLDHTDDRAGYLGPSHARCNALAAARLGNQRARAKRALKGPPRRVASREW